MNLESYKNFSITRQLAFVYKQVRNDQVIIIPSVTRQHFQFPMFLHHIPPFRHRSNAYRETAVESVKVTGLPDIVTQIVSGSLPICSVVKPWVLVTLPGTVSGITTLQVLPIVVRVTAVMVVPLVV